MQFMLRMAFISWMKNVERNASFLHIQCFMCAELNLKDQFGLLAQNVYFAF